MPSIDLVVSTPVSNSMRVRQLESMFDCPREEKQKLEWKLDLPLHEKKWNIGLIVGPSGCGKSTTLRMIAGLEEVSCGNLMFDDELVNYMPPHKRDVAMVFQSYAVFPFMNVFDNVAFA